MKRRRIVITGAAALAGSGLLGMAAPAAQASSALALTWTRQFPATSPPARVGASMAYDAATRSVVLFGGGTGLTNTSSTTWTWDGSTWTKQHPATHPPAGSEASMAYDAATRSVVLFGGDDAAGADPTGTWTWNGSTWTKQHPATHPPATVNASMAYDAATRSIVLFGGSNTRLYSDTWTWNGSAWTKQSTATHPSGRSDASMAYDAATRNIVLFGGFANTGTGSSAATWTWDGSTWTRQSPATHPTARSDASMAYDAATGNIVLFGGVQFGGVSANVQQNLGDTWTWNGSTWTKQSPATHPTARYSASMAYDAATHSIVLFSGFNRHGLDSTWTWG